RFEAQASINGENTQLATLLPANVDSVSLGVGHGGEMVLNLAGLGSIGLSDVFTIGKYPRPNSARRSLIMSFNIGLSGIRAASSDLNITGNNIANASTVGFKAARAEFGDVYAASILGTGSNAMGSGVVLNNVAQLFTQGNINYTDNSLDLAINGNGFFVTSNKGALSYTRAGYFGTDREGFIVNNQGERLQGYGVNALSGEIERVNRVDLRVDTSAGVPNQTSEVKSTLNLNSSQLPPTNPAFDPADSSTYNDSTSVTIYDSLGNSHVLT